MVKCLITLFETKKIQLETLGEYLKAIRSRLNLTLQEVAQGSGVSARWLGSLEAGALGELPADVYVVGLLKQLAKYYHLEEDLLISQFKKEKQIANQISKKEKSKTRSRFSFFENITVTPKLMVILAGGGFIVFTLGYLVWQVFSINRPPFLEITSPKEQVIIKELSVEVAGRTDPGMSVSVNSQEIFVDHDGRFSAKIGLLAGTREIIVVSKNRFDKQSQKSVKIFVEPQNMQNITGSFDLVLEFLGDVTVSFQEEGGTASSSQFTEGDVFKLLAQKPVKLSATDGAMVKAFVNSRDLGTLSKFNEPVENIYFSAESGIIK